MSDTPNLVSGDTEAPTIEAPSAVEQPESATATQRRTVHDVWVAGTEEPDWVTQGTNEGAQELLPADDDPALAIQRGTLVADDYEVDDSIRVSQSQLRRWYNPEHALASLDCWQYPSEPSRHSRRRRRLVRGGRDYSAV